MNDKKNKPGRKPTGRIRKTLTITVDPEIYAFVDGIKNRSKYINDLIFKDVLTKNIEKEKLGNKRF